MLTKIDANEQRMCIYHSPNYHYGKLFRSLVAIILFSSSSHLMFMSLASKLNSVAFCLLCGKVVLYLSECIVFVLPHDSLTQHFHSCPTDIVVDAAISKLLLQ